jgi:hypothetical protein
MWYGSPFPARLKASADRADLIHGHGPGRYGLCAGVSVSGVMAQIAAGAVGYGEGMGCFAAMNTRTAA